MLSTPSYSPPRGNYPAMKTGKQASRFFLLGAWERVGTGEPHPVLFCQTEQTFMMGPVQSDSVRRLIGRPFRFQLAGEQHGSRRVRDKWSARQFPHELFQSRLKSLVV